jgi:hypothetical protein
LLGECRTFGALVLVGRLVFALHSAAKLLVINYCSAESLGLSPAWDSMTSLAFFPVIPSHSGKKKAIEIKNIVIKIKNRPKATTISIEQRLPHLFELDKVAKLSYALIYELQSQRSFF